MSELTYIQQQVLEETGLNELSELRGNLTAFEKSEDSLLALATSLDTGAVLAAAALIEQINPENAALLRELIKEAGKYQVYMEHCLYGQV